MLNESDLKQRNFKNVVETMNEISDADDRILKLLFDYTLEDIDDYNLEQQEIAYKFLQSQLAPGVM